MTSTAPTITPSLSFPPATYQKVDPSSYLLRHLEPTFTSTSSHSAPTSTRPSGRSPTEFRTPTIHTSSLSHAHGSAVVRTGDTAVVCGVRGEILTLSGGEKKVIRSGLDQLGNSGNEDESNATLRSYPLLVPNLEFNTGCAAQYHPGPPSDSAQAMTQRLKSLLLEVVCPVDIDDLSIFEQTDPDSEDQLSLLLSSSSPEIKAYWVLYIDTLLISLDGNPFDAAWAAIISALNSTTLPHAYFDPNTQRVLCHPTKTRKLRLKQFAFSSTFGIFTAPPGEDIAHKKTGNTWILADPDDFEEGVCEERVWVVMRDEETIAKLEKGGGRVVGSTGGGAAGRKGEDEEDSVLIGTGLAGVKDLQKCVKVAGERWKVWNDLIRGASGKGKDAE